MVEVPTRDDGVTATNISGSMRLKDGAGKVNNLSAISGIYAGATGHGVYVSYPVTPVTLVAPVETPESTQPTAEGDETVAPTESAVPTAPAAPSESAALPGLVKAAAMLP